MFKRILIANRGEIACRIIRTCRRLGIDTVAVYSDADADAQHVRQADLGMPVGASAPSESYLRGDAVIAVAQQTGAEAIHPGYGFLAENAEFARACEAAGIVFIGPRAETIETMGSKAAAKALMQEHDVPLVPGYHGADQDADTLIQHARKIGFPLMIKAAAGGGGKGMRGVHDEKEFAGALSSAQREAQSAFGDARMILERLLEHPRHIEFQVFADTEGSTIHLFERECSAQRRFQKVLEETPSPFLTPERRAAMGEAAVAAARAVNYLGAGTVEFIVGADGEFYFMEMNTRLQVEHPVTEMTLGLDLVEWQLRVAAGEALPLSQTQLEPHGHAIEVRLYAEDPAQGFLPSSGVLESLRLPNASTHVRIDSGVIEGDKVTIFYDPMIAKLIVHDANREQAMQRLRNALAVCEVLGPKTNIAFLERLARHPAVTEGRIDTGYLDRHLDEFLRTDAAVPELVLFAAATACLLRDEQKASTSRADPHSPWAMSDGWRVGHAGKRVIALELDGERHQIEAHGHRGDYALRTGATSCVVACARVDNKVLTAHFDTTARRIPLRETSGLLSVHDHDGIRYRFQRAAAYTWAANDSVGANQLLAPMPGRIVLLQAKVGDQVEQGQDLLAMEAMKMELTLKAPRAGTIDEISAAEGDFVEADAVLVRFAEN